MYKLFLCLRYLRSRLIAYFAVGGVALCVFMVLVAVSVMNGFLNKIEHAAKGLFGDIVINSTNLSGIGYYDEFIDKITAPNTGIPEVKAASPFIMTLGILRLPDAPSYRTPVQIAGIRLPQRTAVTDFANGLHFEKDLKHATFDPPWEYLLKGVQKEYRQTETLRQKIIDGTYEDVSTTDKAHLLECTERAMGFQRGAISNLQKQPALQKELASKKAQLKKLDAEGNATDEQRDDLLNKIGFLEKRALGPASKNLILGLGIPGLSMQLDSGETIRFIVPGHKVVLTLIPLGREAVYTAGTITPNTATFTVIDDEQSGVWSIDKDFVYVPLETLQKLNNMAAEYSADDPNQVVIPARVSQIHIKVANSVTDEASLRAIAANIDRAWRDFVSQYPGAATSDITVNTWRQQQADVIAPIESQRTLVVIMFSIISLVAVVLIFAIFYMIVMQRTKDIGIIKAVGGSSGGVAVIFLSYGAAVGLVGAILGAIGGYYFVRYINPIQDLFRRWFGFQVWSRSTFMFDKIPNTVDPLTVTVIMVGAIIAGVLGALIPAIVAARMQPVEALRYE